jgi:hypothetical protein
LSVSLAWLVLVIFAGFPFLLVITDFFTGVADFRPSWELLHIIPGFWRAGRFKSNNLQKTPSECGNTTGKRDNRSPEAE